MRQFCRAMDKTHKQLKCYVYKNIDIAAEFV